MVENRAPQVVDLDFGIEVQPACQEPRAFLASSIAADRQRITVQRTGVAARVVEDGELPAPGSGVQPACQAPRCDPSTWTRAEREVVVVPADWFDPWRALYGMAAMRGERWLGKPVESVASGEAGGP